MQSHTLSQYSPWQSSPWRTQFDRFPNYRRRYVSETSISLAEFAFHQHRSAQCDIGELIAQCRDRYRFAHELIKPHANLPERLLDRSVVDTADFYLPWSELCSAYRTHLFDPQICLFEDQRKRELRRWQAFVEHECFARFARHPEWVRSVLETARLLPERGPTRTIPIADLIGDIVQDLQERSEHDPNRDE